VPGWRHEIRSTYQSAQPSIEENRKARGKNGGRLCTLASAPECCIRNGSDLRDCALREIETVYTSDFPLLSGDRHQRSTQMTSGRGSLGDNLRLKPEVNGGIPEGVA
jgi:hypothetical protein